MKETQIQKVILDYLHTIGIFAWRANNAPVYDPKRGCYRAHNGIKGLPDICGILGGPKGGVFLGVEVKTDKGEMSEHQLFFHAEARKLGAVVFVARSLDDVKDALKRFEEKK